ncbi:MAG TPA: zinc ABC transporter substrate-binding protein [Selenomonas sp.]|nr:zinc ABC transporter substrate-binding protein [Selenomonadaceae bacterium]HCB92797.1 zinc ABC transporter substrate-binding protein [Selenomonas sp.]
MILTLCAMVVVAGCGGVSEKKEDKFHIVTSFYPMYIDAANIAQGVEGVEVINMTKPQTGCLHDYQLTTEDMKTLEKADVFIINGIGMESFMEKAMEAQKGLKVIDASKSDKINVIMNGDEPNPHVWMSVTYSIAQVKAITSQLCELDPAHEKEYKKNALDYVMKLEKLREDMHAELDTLPNKDIVTFHEAFPYFAKEFKLHIAAVIEREPGTEPTPKELEDTIGIVSKLPVKALFTEPQYSPAAAETIARETGAHVYILDPVVTGEANEKARDAYIDSMKKNMEVLREALK